MVQSEIMYQNLNILCTYVVLMVGKASADPAYATVQIQLIKATIYSPVDSDFELVQLYFNLTSDDQSIAVASYETMMLATYEGWYIKPNLRTNNAIAETHGGLSADGILFNALVDISSEIQLGIDVRLSHFPINLNENDLSLDFDRSATEKVTFTVCNGTCPAAPPQENTIQWNSYPNSHGAVYDTLTYNVSINCSSDCYANYSRSLRPTVASATVEIALMKAQIHTPNETYILLQMYFHLLVQPDIIASATYETIVNVTENGSIQQDLNHTNAIAELHGGLPKDGVLFNAFLDISNTPEIQLVIDIRVSTFQSGSSNNEGVEFSLCFEKTVNHTVHYMVRNGTSPQNETINWDSNYQDDGGLQDSLTYGISITCSSNCYEIYIQPPTSSVETTTITPSTMTSITTSETTSATSKAFHTPMITETTSAVTSSEEPLRPSNSSGNTGFIVALVVTVICMIAQAVLLLSAFLKGHKFWPLFNRKNPKLNEEDVNVENMHSTVMRSDQQSPTNYNSTTFATAMYHNFANVPTLPTAGCTEISNEYDDYVKPSINSDEYVELQQ